MGPPAEQTLRTNADDFSEILSGLLNNQNASGHGSANCLRIPPAGTQGIPGTITVPSFRFR